MVYISPSAWGIPVVASNTERDSNFPNPSVNFRVHNLQEGAIERWNGTSWVVDFLNTGLSTGTPAAYVNGVELLALPQGFDFRGRVTGQVDGPVARITVPDLPVSNAGGVVMASPSGIKFTGTGVTVTDAGGGLVQCSIIAGGGVSLADNGSPVGASPFGTLNLVGFTVTDAGGGVADITVIPGISVEEGSTPVGSAFHTLNVVGMTAVDDGGGVVTLTVIPGLSPLSITDGAATTMPPDGTIRVPFLWSMVMGDPGAGSVRTTIFQQTSGRVLMIGANDTSSSRLTEVHIRASNSGSTADIVLIRSGRVDIQATGGTGTVTNSLGSVQILTGSSGSTSNITMRATAGGGYNIGFHSGNGGIVFLGNGSPTPGILMPSTDGGVTLGRVTGGDRYFVDLALSGTIYMKSQTSGAAAQAGTLNNAPSAGDPNFWLKININGTDRYIPAW
jgi:hypothetical protein